MGRGEQRANSANIKLGYKFQIHGGGGGGGGGKNVPPYDACLPRQTI